MDRSFTVSKSEVNVTGGSYKGKSPYNAAAKAARAIFKESGTKKKEIRFTLEDESSGKTFNYIGVKESLDTPLVIKRGDSKIKIAHKYHIKSCRP